VRLYCIDAPELAQAPWGRESRDHLRQIAPRQVTLRIRDTDRYGRKVAEVLTMDGENLNKRQVRDGQAAVYRQFCPDPAYGRLEADARAQGLGIWEKPGAQQTPWVYRHRHP
jgi:endonuclease YncB( thermonuclease family)